MSLTLPIEDISRLRVFAHLNNSGLPVLSLSLRSTAAGTESGMKPPPSGIYINFERTNEGGCWSLAMKAIFEEKTDNQGSLQDPLADSMQRPATNISSIISSTSLDFSTFTAEFPDPLSFFAASFGSQIDQDPTMLSNVPSGPGANQALPMLPFPLIPEPEQPSFSSPATTTHIQQSETQPYSSSSSSPSNGPEYADSPPSSGPERIHTHPKKPKRKLPCSDMKYQNMD
ncbi:hypothetical protein WG66_007681 [Moniliophthora roreri]|nr:hypothetical protein WG66_007681 [Moniliophthora roreri]